MNAAATENLQLCDITFYDILNLMRQLAAPTPAEKERTEYSDWAKNSTAPALLSRGDLSEIIGCSGDVVKRLDMDPQNKKMDRLSPAGGRFGEEELARIREFILSGAHTARFITAPVLKSLLTTSREVRGKRITNRCSRAFELSKDYISATQLVNEMLGFAMKNRGTGEKSSFPDENSEPFLYSICIFLSLLAIWRIPVDCGALQDISRLTAERMGVKNNLCQQMVESLVTRKIAATEDNRVLIDPAILNRVDQMLQDQEMAAKNACVQSMREPEFRFLPPSIRRLILRIFLYLDNEPNRETAAYKAAASLQLKRPTAYETAVTGFDTLQFDLRSEAEQYADMAFRTAGNGRNTDLLAKLVLADCARNEEQFARYHRLYLECAAEEDQTTDLTIRARAFGGMLHTCESTDRITLGSTEEELQALEKYPKNRFLLRTKEENISYILYQQGVFYYRKRNMEAAILVLESSIKKTNSPEFYSLAATTLAAAYGYRATGLKKAIEVISACVRFRLVQYGRTQPYATALDMQNRIVVRAIAYGIVEDEELLENVVYPNAMETLEIHMKGRNTDQISRSISTLDLIQRTRDLLEKKRRIRKDQKSEEQGTGAVELLLEDYEKINFGHRAEKSYSDYLDKAGQSGE